MPDIVIEIGILNIKASPHPPGIYPKLLRNISNTPVGLWGDDFLAIKPPVRVETGFYRGQILVWTEVDPSAPAVDKSTLEALTLDAANVVIDSNIGINLRVFLYVLRESDHLIFFEYRNDTGNHLAGSRLVKALEKLFYRTNTRGDMRVEIDVVPEEDALNRVLAIPRIRILEIHLKKPNPDDNTAAAAEIMKDLEEQGAGQKNTTFTAKSPKAGIKPNAKTVVEAEVAADNGYVRAVGKDRTGKKVELSTQEYPKVISIPLSE